MDLNLQSFKNIRDSMIWKKAALDQIKMFEDLAIQECSRSRLKN